MLAKPLPSQRPRGLSTAIKVPIKKGSEVAAVAAGSETAGTRTRRASAVGKLRGGMKPPVRRTGGAVEEDDDEE